MSDPEGRRRILGRKFLMALMEAGIIAKGDYVRRVVIDADVNNALVVHVERWGDERFLAIAHTLDGVEILREDGPREFVEGEIRYVEETMPGSDKSE